MNVSLLNKMLRPKIISVIIILGILIFMLPTSFYSIKDFTSMNMAWGSFQSPNEQKENIVKIIKDSMTSYYIVNNETEFIGTFDTTYSISGNSASLTNSRDTIISVIQEDFSRSPTMGYVTVGNISTTSTADALASNRLSISNPFADPAAINQTISQKVSNAIETLDRREVPTIEIECDFDMNIAEWNCVN